MDIDLNPGRVRPSKITATMQRKKGLDLEAIVSLLYTVLRLLLAGRWLHGLGSQFRDKRYSGNIQGGLLRLRNLRPVFNVYRLRWSDKWSSTDLIRRFDGPFGEVNRDMVTSMYGARGQAAQ